MKERKKKIKKEEKKRKKRRRYKRKGRRKSKKGQRRRKRKEIKEIDGNSIDEKGNKESRRGIMAEQWRSRSADTTMDYAKLNSTTIGSYNRHKTAMPEVCLDE